MPDLTRMMLALCVYPLQQKMFRVPSGGNGGKEVKVYGMVFALTARTQPVLDWSQIKYETDDSGFWNAETAAMNCSSCGVVWNESDRKQAIHAGKYIHKDPENLDKSFFVPGPAHIWTSIKEIVNTGSKAWRAAQEDNDWAPYQNFVNEIRGEPWDRSEQGLSARKLQNSTYSLGSAGAETLGVLDERINLITMGADVQKYSIHAEIMGWGVDDNDGRLLCFGLRYIVVKSIDGEDINGSDLWNRFDKELSSSLWSLPGSGISVGVQRGCIDSRYQTPRVREWVQSKYKEELALKKLKPLPYGATLIPSMSKSIGNGKRISLDPVMSGKSSRSKYRMYIPLVLNIDSNLVKDDLWESLKADKTLPESKEKANLYPSMGEKFGYTSGYFSEMTSEMKVSKRNPTRPGFTTQWVLNRGKGLRNEAFDCRVYGLGAALLESYGNSELDNLPKSC